jgi:PiT family inorganic phosphate transporter
MGLEPILVVSLGASAYVGWNIGANDTANCIGTTIGCGLIKFHQAVVLVALFSIAGALIQGEAVMKTVGKGITPLDIPGAFIAQFSSALGMHLFSVLGIPVSTSSAIVGAVLGVGLVKGAKSISQATIFKILGGWVLTPTCAAGTSFWVTGGSNTWPRGGNSGFQ